VKVVFGAAGTRRVAVAVSVMGTSGKDSG